MQLPSGVVRSPGDPPGADPDESLELREISDILQRSNVPIEVGLEIALEESSRVDGSSRFLY
jgi:hypothetical protein